LGLTLSMVALAVFAGVIAPGDPLRSIGAPLQAPSSQHLFGTDDLGRDMLAQVVHGSRASLLVGLTTAFVAAVIGSVVGATAGYFGRRVDDVLMRITELFQVVPRFFLAILVAALFGANLRTIILLLGLTFWPGPARLLRSQVLALRERDFVLAARAVGAPTRVILWRHILPNALPPVIVSAALQVGGAILTEASLSFLGLGERSIVSWGYLLNNAQAFLRVAWWMSAFPGLALMLTVLGVNLLSDGLNDGWNPYLKRGRRT
ncbi:MAG: ABC transporter permease, partial [Anaerolineae bacterium]|nr:ABC transporter permease [Anaerolineae bacterium]